MKKSKNTDQGKDKKMPLVADEYYEFCELSSGDHFACNGIEYEKITPDQAIKTYNNTIEEFEKDTKVYYFDPYH